LSDEERRDLERLKKQVEKKDEELQSMYATLDKQRIEILQLNYNYKNVSKIKDEVKDEN
jgi:hypothetical protein